MGLVQCLLFQTETQHQDFINLMVSGILISPKMYENPFQRKLQLFIKCVWIWRDKNYLNLTIIWFQIEKSWGTHRVLDQICKLTSICIILWKFNYNIILIVSLSKFFRINLIK